MFYYKSKFLAERVAVLALVLAAVMVVNATSAQAFCVYNRTNETISVEQVGGHRRGRGMDVTIRPGKHKCCNWKNKDCNSSGKKTSKVRFSVWYAPGRYKQSTRICKGKAVKAAGWLSVRGNHPDGKCVARY